MTRIIFAVVVVALFVAPAAAQDWERVFSDGAPEPAFKVLMLDPSEPRESRDRYKLAPLGGVGLTAWAVAQRSGHFLRLDPTAPAWSLLLFTGPSILPFVDPSAEVVAVFDGAREAVLHSSGSPLRWGELETGALHVMVRGPDGALVLMR